MAAVAAAAPRAVPTAADFFLYCITQTPAQSSAGGIFLPFFYELYFFVLLRFDLLGIADFLTAKFSDHPAYLHTVQQRNEQIPLACSLRHLPSSILDR